MLRDCGSRMTMQRGRDARKLLVPHFDLPVMVVLETVLPSLRAWVRPDGSVIAVARFTDDDLRRAMIGFGWRYRKWASECLWWDEQRAGAWPNQMMMGPVQQRPSSFVPDGAMYYSTDTSEIFVFVGPRGDWISNR